MKKTQIKITAMLAALLLCSASLFTACSPENSDVSAVSSSSEVSSTVSQSSSGLRDDSSSTESQSDNSQTLPDVSADDPDFVQLFAENPLDASYSQEAENAASTGQMLSVMNRYIEFWKTEVDGAYQQLMNKTSGEGKESIRTQQEEWLNGTEETLRSIEEDAQGDGTARQLEICGQILSYYRARAASLYSQLYQIEPDFSYQFSESDAASSQES